MLLAIDVGNTNIVLGTFEGDRLTESWRIATLRERTADELGSLITDLFEHRELEPRAVEGIIIASVVPPLTGSMVEMSRRYFDREPYLIDPATQRDIAVKYDNPAEVGADRIVNGIAAYELYGRARHVPLIVVDFGTATTFDVVSREGEYLGGAICPGVQISADALFQRAARLPRVDVRKPESLIGRNTVASMQAGLFYGYVAMVEGIVERLREELRTTMPVEAKRGGEHQHHSTSAFCIGTGGLAEVIAAETPIIEEVNKDLTLHGLRIVWERQG